jgi:hypothetical protein
MKNIFYPCFIRVQSVAIFLFLFPSVAGATQPGLRSLRSKESGT